MVTLSADRLICAIAKLKSCIAFLCPVSITWILIFLFLSITTNLGVVLALPPQYLFKFDEVVGIFTGV